MTPANYFEGPFMVKEKGRYLLMYSDGNTTKDTYKVRYAVGTSPMGPFTEAANSPVLETDAAKQIISPGHHAVRRQGAVLHPLSPPGAALRDGLSGCCDRYRSIR